MLPRPVLLRWAVLSALLAAGGGWCAAPTPAVAPEVAETPAPDPERSEQPARDAPARPDPYALLQAAARFYGSLQSLQVRARTEVPVQPKDRRLIDLPKMRDNRAAGVLEEGTWVDEYEYRAVRNGPARVRNASLGCAGSSTTYMADRALQTIYGPADFSTGGAAVAIPPSRLTTSWRYMDGTTSLGVGPVFHFGLGRRFPSPFALFLAIRPQTILAAHSATYAGPGVAAGAPCHVLRFSINRTVLGKSPLENKPFTRKWKSLKSATWTLWIGQGEPLIHRVDVREEWNSKTVEGGVGLLELRELYVDQLLNPTFTEADFRPAPLDPVQPVREERKPTAVPQKEPPGNDAPGPDGGPPQ